MSKKNIYLILVVLGVLLPYSLFLPWILNNGLDFGLFFKELFINDVAGTWTRYIGCYSGYYNVYSA